MNLLSIGKVAKLLDYSPSTVRRLPIPYVRWGDTAHRRYRQEDVDKFIASLGSRDMLPVPEVNRAIGGSSNLAATVAEVRRLLKEGK